MRGHHRLRLLVRVRGRWSSSAAGRVGWRGWARRGGCRAPARRRPDRRGIRIRRGASAIRGRGHRARRGRRREGGAGSSPRAPRRRARSATPGSRSGAIAAPRGAGKTAARLRPRREVLARLARLVEGYPMFPRSDPSRVCALRDVERQRAPVAVSPSTVHRPLARPRNVTFLKWAGHSRRSPGRNVYRYVIPVSQNHPTIFGTRAPHDSLTIVTLDPNRSWQGINSDTWTRKPIRWLGARFVLWTDGSSFYDSAVCAAVTTRRRGDKPSRSPKRRAALERLTSRATHDALGTSPPPVASRGDARRAISSRFFCRK